MNIFKPPVKSEYYIVNRARLIKELTKYKMTVLSLHNYCVPKYPYYIPWHSLHNRSYGNIPLFPLFFFIFNYLSKYLYKILSKKNYGELTYSTLTCSIKTSLRRIKFRRWLNYSTIPCLIQSITIRFKIGRTRFTR